MRQWFRVGKLKLRFIRILCDFLRGLLWLIARSLLICNVSDDSLANFASLTTADECLDYLGIVSSAYKRADSLDCLVEQHSFGVRTIDRHCIECIGYGYNFSLKRNFIAF